jgi:uncharacterized protein (DUF924 family)
VIFIILCLMQAKDEQAAGILEMALAFSRDHMRVIQRFGRFPSRNASLGRANTAQEETYIKEEMTSVWELSQAAVKQ